MQWASWSAFFNMGGYAFYVWFSFGLSLVCIILEVSALRKRRAQALRFSRLLAQK